MSTYKILALALMFTVAACKEDAPCHQGEAGLYLTSEWATEVAAGSYLPGTPVDSSLVHTIYHYDENRHLDRIEKTYTKDDSTRYEHTVAYQRDGCGNVLREVSPYSMTGIEQRTFTYNEAGQCINIHYEYDSNTFDDSITYSANRVEMIRYRNGTFDNVYSYFFIDVLTQNITRSTHRVSPITSYSIVYHYDDKPNPRKKMMLPPDDYNFANDFSTNNIIYISGTDTIGYTYNEQGYPISLGNKTFHYQDL